MNHPSKWFDFVSQKELHRLRQDINNTTSLRIQVFISVLIAILSPFLSQLLSKGPIVVQIIVCATLCLLAVVVFLIPLFEKKFSTLKNQNIIINGKEATTIFDDDIVYSILTACEYYNAKSSIPANALSPDLHEFYELEINYYVRKASNCLESFSATICSIIGNGENQIAKERMENLLKMMKTLMENTQNRFSPKDIEYIDEFYKVIQKIQSDES